jgi:putative endonuclease
MHYVYVLMSELDRCFYTGCTGDLRERLAQHKAGRVPSTKERGSLKLIYYDASLNKADAFRREKYLKTTYGKRYIRNRCKDYFTG